MSLTVPTGNVEALLLARGPESFFSHPVPEIYFDLESQTMVGDTRRGGQTILADVRSSAYRRKVDTVLNRQVVSVVGSPDLDYISSELDLDEGVALKGLLNRYHADAERGGLEVPDDYVSVLHDLKDDAPGELKRLFLAQCLGANLVVGEFDGAGEVDEFRNLSRGIDFGPYNDATHKFTDATVVITRPNRPCITAGKMIEDVYADRPSLAKEFVVAAQGRRGFVGMIAKGGSMVVGQTLGFVPYGD